MIIVIILLTTIGGILFIFKLLHIDNDNLENIIIFALLIPVGIYFTYKSTKRERDEEKKELEKRDEN